MRKLCNFFMFLCQQTEEQTTEDNIIRMYRFGLYLQENKGVDNFIIDFDRSDYSFSMLITIGSVTIPFYWSPRKEKEKSIKAFFDEIENYINHNLN